MIVSNGILNIDDQKITAPDTGAWEDLTTWEDWTSYNLEAPEYLYWLVDIVDLGQKKNFCLNITAEAQGIVDYYIYTSDTGAFAGEETETVILAEDTAVPAFSGRYVIVGVSVEYVTAPQEITRLEVRVSDAKNSLSIDNINTADINDGSTQGYVLPLPKPVGTITNVQITPREVAPFELDVYVTDYATSTVVIPHVTSKSADSVSFALVGLDNKPRDAIVDVVIEFLPEMFRDGNSLRLR